MGVIIFIGYKLRKIFDSNDKPELNLFVFSINYLIIKKAQ